MDWFSGSSPNKFIDQIIIRMLRRTQSMHSRRPLQRKSTVLFNPNNDEQEPNSQEEDEKQDVLNLNYFKVKKNHANYNLQQMLQQGKIQENEVDHNPHFPSPTINTKLIHNIFQLNYAEKADNHARGPRLESLEIIQKFTNKKLVNQILFNKMRKKRTVSQHELDNSTSNVLQSFKSLATMFKSVNQLVDYHSVATQIRQSFSQVSITREKEVNLERQQYNFNYIVEGRLSQIKKQTKDVEDYSASLQQLRVENCNLREQIIQITQEVSKIQYKYEKQRMNIMHSEDKIHPNRKWDKKQFIQQIDENERIELSRVKKMLQDLKQQLDRNSEELRKREDILNDLKLTKKQCKQDLSEFLKQVLVSEEIQQGYSLNRISESLISVIKILMQINEKVSLQDFPCFLDEPARLFLLNKAMLEKQQERNKDVQRETKQGATPAPSSFGQRPKYEEKLQEVMNSIKKMKRHRYSGESLGLTQTQVQQPTFENVNDLSPIEGADNRGISNAQSALVESQILDLEQQEISRLAYLYQGKQLPNSSQSKLIRTLHAEFGHKQLHQKLTLVLPNYDISKLAYFPQSHPQKKVQFKG